MNSTSLPGIHSIEQTQEKISPAVKRKILIEEGFILAKKRQALAAKSSALAAESKILGEKSETMEVKRTLFAVESLILEEKSRDLAVKQITLAMKLEPWKNDPGFWLSDYSKL
jgi:hypothetical protein